MIGVPSNHGVQYFIGPASPRMFAVDGPVFGVCQKMSKKSKEVEKSQKKLEKSRNYGKNVKKSQISKKN